VREPGDLMLQLREAEALVRKAAELYRALSEYPDSTQQERDMADELHAELYSKMLTLRIEWRTYRKGLVNG